MEDFEDIDVLDLYFKHDTPTEGKKETDSMNDKKEKKIRVNTDPSPGTSGAYRKFAPKDNEKNKGKEKKLEKKNSPTENLDQKTESLKQRIKELEQETERRKRKYDELQEENKRLKTLEKTDSKDFFAFDLDPSVYLRGDMKEANAYLSRTIVPKVKRLIDQNEGQFRIIKELGKVCEPVTETTPRTCIQYNRGKYCPEGEMHLDKKGNKRIHCCSICWEALWAFVPHRVVACPLIAKKFWSTMDCDKKS